MMENTEKIFLLQCLILLLVKGMFFLTPLEFVIRK